MTWLETQMALLDAATAAFEFAVNSLLQSTLLIAVGLTIGRLMRRQGSAAQSAVYRTTLAAVILCPIATLGLSLTGIWEYSLQPDCFVSTNHMAASVTEKTTIHWRACVLKVDALFL